MKNARIEIKTNDAIKSKLQRAAMLNGVSLSDFIIQAAVEQAETVLGKEMDAIRWDRAFRRIQEVLCLVKPK